jgi:probable HAF family extracellular repeat protein
MLDLGTLGGKNSFAYAINSVDRVVGTSETADGSAHAFEWSRAGLRDLGALGGSASQAWGVNTAGQVVGFAYTALGSEEDAFVYTEATGIVNLNTQIDPSLGFHLRRAQSINDAGQIVGIGLHDGQERAFRLTPR